MPHGALLDREGTLVRRDYCLIAAVALACFVAADMLIASLLLLGGIAVSPIIVPLAALAATAGAVVTCRKSPRLDLAVGIVLAALVALACVALASAFVDMSYDGNSYHKAAIGALANGWNPVYESISDWWARSPLELSPVTHALWADHYAKGSWLFSASLYVPTGSIESGKAINLIVAASSALLVFDWLRVRLSSPRAALVAAVLVVNPVTAPLMLTNYVDGLLACALYGVICCLVALSDHRCPRTRGGVLWLALAAYVLICVNIKFTGFVYAGFFCGSFYVLWLVRAWRAERAAASRQAVGRHARAQEDAPASTMHPVTAKGPAAAFLRLTGYYLAVVIVSACLAGSNTYVTNTIDHGSPFYPLISAQRSEIIDGYQPDSFEEMNPYKKFALSLLSHTENAWKDPVRLKVPLTFEASELAVSSYDTRRAGFGAFSSAIFIGSALCLLIAAVRQWRRAREPLASAAAVAIPSLVLVGLTDGSWWARYTPYLWLLPVAALAWLLAKRQGHSCRVARGLCAAALTCLVAVNLATFAPVLRSTIATTREVRAFCAQAQQAGHVELALDDQALGSYVYNVIDAGVSYRYVTRLEGDAQLEAPLAGLRARTVPSVQ